ncbi:sugar kinase [Pseudoalteromonas sp. SG41-1]|uniref:sugar kinase n=1 Tax=Pseudoalteromonas sp. SG41-1 TaxID=2760979 RepID=UPI0015FF08D9|nr:sugar kinase [Pseudoalteromonas sp. SG41-1]MBB1504092.1 sugar kinase [Pseudoalteromonas sp. SG41-1]
MESPEIFLKELNSTLRRLRGASNVLANEEIDKKLLAVMRRLLLAEILGNEWIIAVGGSQGAGKTTLMSKIYDCGDWLQGNEGRGEKLPVMIIETNEVSAPQGYVRRLQKSDIGDQLLIKDVLINVENFNQVITDPSAEDLLPVLKVPKRYFKRENQSWLLLPGYEKQDRDNKDWQELMRQAMIAAGGCIVVTDETRMANQQQLDITKDMLANELKHCEPCVVISKTESYKGNSDRQSQLKNSAMNTFKIDESRIDKQIILTGTDDSDYCEEWMPKLVNMIDELNYTGQSNRVFQTNNLAQLIGRDLTKVLNSIRSKARLIFNSSEATESALMCKELLGEFDDSVTLLREEHKKIAKAHVDRNRINAAKKLDEKLSLEHEGFKNFITSSLESTTEKKTKIKQTVEEAWQQEGSNFLSDYASQLTGLTLEKLGPVNNSEIEISKNETPKLPNTKKLIELGYAGRSGKPIQFKVLSEEIKNDIKIVLSHNSNTSSETSKKLAESVRLIPIISLEYARLSYSVPKLLADELKLKMNDNDELIEQSVEAISKGANEGRNALKAVAALLAVDVISDGDSDILGTLFGHTKNKESETSSNDFASEESTNEPEGGSVPPVMLHPAAIAVTAVVAACYVTTKAVSGLRKQEQELSIQAHSLLNAISDSHYVNFCSSFDEVMRSARSRLEFTLRQRYHLDEHLMRKERLTKALADVIVLSNDLKAEIDSSASGLNPLLVGHTAEYD